MNVICDRALLGAYSRETRQVNRALVRGAASEVSGKLPKSRWPRWLAATAAIATLAVLALAINNYRTSGGEAGEAPLAAEGGARTGETVTLLAVDPNVGDILPQEDESVLDDIREPLAERLGAGSLSATANQAIATVLAKWDVTLDAAGGGACVQARAAGLSCLLQRGSFNVLRQLDRPAVLTLTGNSGHTYPAALVSLEGDVAELAFGEETVIYPVDEVARLWFGQYLIVWRPPNGTPTSIRPGMRSADVLWLRESLAALAGGATGTTSDPDFFDGELEAQLRSFQRRHRLQVDGLAGEQTQIIINSMLADGRTPRLSGDI